MPTTIHIFNHTYSPEEFVGQAFSDHEFPGLTSAQSFIRFLLDHKQFFDQKTSGSTGKPTIHKINRQQLEASAKRTADTLRLTNQTRVLVCINMDYIGGKMMLARGLFQSWQLHLVPPVANPATLLNKTLEFDFMALVPLQLEAMLANEEGIHLLNKTRKLIIGGAAVSQSLRDKLQPLACQVYATYGMTETVSHVALQKLNGPDQSDYFQLLPGIEYGLDDRQCLKLKADVTQDQWIQTNDVVEFASEGAFRVLGRADNIVNTGGVKVQIEALEAQIQSTDLLGEVPFAITSQPDESLGQKLVLVIEQGSTDIDHKLLSQMKPLLPPYHSPKKLISLSVLPKTESGKLNRQALQQKVKDL